MLLIIFTKFPLLAVRMLHLISVFAAEIKRHKKTQFDCGLVIWLPITTFIRLNDFTIICFCHSKQKNAIGFSISCVFTDNK